MIKWLVKSLENIYLKFYLPRVQGSSERGKGEIPPPPPPKPKTLLWENGVISEGSIFSNKFSKKIKIKNKKIQFFYRIFIDNVTNFSKFPTICVFRPNAQKLTHGLLNILKNILK